MSNVRKEQTVEVARSGESAWVFLAGGVCMWVRTDSPTTPLPKTINCLNHQQPFLMKVVGIRQGKNTHGFFSLIGQGLTNSPHPYPCENHAPFDLVATIVAGRVHLIMDAYLHDDKLKTYAACPDIHSVTNLNPKHSITDRWWGLGL